MTLEDHELDEIVRGARARFIARADACFDFDAGLADVYERADLRFAWVPARLPPSGPGPLSAAVALACADIDEFVVALTAGLLTRGPLPDLVGSDVQRAADVLLGLRGELAAGTASAATVESVLASARDALGHGLDADPSLRRLEDRLSAVFPEPAQRRAARPRQARRREGGQARSWS